MMSLAMNSTGMALIQMLGLTIPLATAEVRLPCTIIMEPDMDSDSQGVLVVLILK